MEQNIVETPHLFNAWAWVEKNKKQVGIGAAAVVVVGLIIGYTTWTRNAKEEAASHTLSQTLYTVNRGGAEASAAFQKVAAENSGTKAATQALLLAAGALFNGGKYAEAQTAFEQFSRDHASSSLAPQAVYGSGAALAAQGKSAEAAAAYKSVVDRYPNSAVAPQARFALAGTLAAQGDLNQAITLYEEVARSSMGSSLGNEAGLRADELRAKLPPVSATPALAPATNAPAAKP
jgi:TolA-binding protein